jgi:hypothetical protein
LIRSIRASSCLCVARKRAAASSWRATAAALCCRSNNLLWCLSGLGQLRLQRRPRLRQPVAGRLVVELQQHCLRTDHVVFGDRDGDDATRDGRGERQDAVIEVGHAETEDHRRGPSGRRLAIAPALASSGGSGPPNRRR